MYTIHIANDKRILEVDNNGLNTRRFKQLVPIYPIIDTIEYATVPVKFKRITSNRVLAIVSDIVQVYKLPNHIQLHNEVLKQNSRMLYDATRVYNNTDVDTIALDYDNLVNNMLEFDCTI